MRARCGREWPDGRARRATSLLGPKTTRANLKREQQAKQSVSKGNGLSLRQRPRQEKEKKETPRRAVQLANKGPGAGAEATGETLMS